MAESRLRTSSTHSTISVHYRGVGDGSGDGSVHLTATPRGSRDEPPPYPDPAHPMPASLSSPLLHVRSSYAASRTSFSTAPDDLLEDQNTDLAGDSVCGRACFTECCSTMGCIRFVILLCNAVGFGLLYWEYVYWSGLPADAGYNERKKVGLRLAFGCVILFFAYPVYLGDVFYASDTFKALRKMASRADLQNHLDAVARGQPSVTWHMKCFHQDNRTVTITAPDGTSRTEHHNEKVIVWTGEETFHFRGWEDVSPGEQLAPTGSYQTVTFHKKYVLADKRSREAFQAQKEAFVNANRRRDQEYSLEETFEVDGFLPGMVARTRSWSLTLNMGLYVFFGLAFLHQPWSCIIRLGERRISYHHVKKLSV
ncbi:uncharacterized protein LOC129590977 [Paramacrobiotus metropolitanus]|uniref:uncharacterized protein LOC129590977 n=1 Tax=Paramacrobiotus metropolitanus TaxID=2943436 RepID=UPI002445E30A|nr:uncharacterized protein LOC129590977 [Paramacrobiotus metropolitanus]